MDLKLVETILYFLSGGFLIFLAITLTRDNISNRLNRITSAMLAFAGVGPIFMALGSIITHSAGVTSSFEESTLYRLQHIWEFFFPLLLAFSWIYPIDRFKRFKLPQLFYLVFLPTIIHLVLLISFNQLTVTLASIKVDPTDEGFISILMKPVAQLSTWLLLMLGFFRTYHQTIFNIIYLLYIGTAIYYLESGRRLVTSPRLLSQTKVVLWGIRISLGILIIARLGGEIIPYRLSEDISSILMILAILSGAGFFMFATVRHQFLDVRLVFRQSFVYTITSAILVGTYIILVIQSKTFLAPIFGEQSEIVSYAFIICLLLLFQPINNWIDNAIRSMFLRTRTDHRNVIERFSRQVISQFDPKQLRQNIDEMLKTTLLVDRVYFVLFDDDVEEYAVLPSDDFPKRVVLSRDDLMLRGINLLDNPAHYTALTGFREGSELAEILEERKVRLVLPMKDAEHLLGFLALTDKITGYRYSSDDFNLLGVLSNQMVSALTNARLYVESLERIRLQEEVSMARQIQLDLLPSCPPPLNMARICAHSTPSRTVGGDFYDFVPLDSERIGIVIADASGKGLPAALMITQIQAIIRSELNNGSPIPTMLKNVNQQVVTSTSSENYATLFYGELNDATGDFHYANAGHNYPILVRSDGTCELLKTGGTVVGALPKMMYESSTVKLNSDDMLFLFTDGLSEAMNTKEEEYTEERIRNFICQNRHHEPDQLVDMILKDVHSYDPADPPRDDTTIIALKVNRKPTKHEK